MFTEKDLVAGETVLVRKGSDVKVLYLGSAGLAHFISQDNEFKIGYDSIYTIEAINKYFTIEQTITDCLKKLPQMYPEAVQLGTNRPLKEVRARFRAAVERMFKDETKKT